MLYKNSRVIGHLEVSSIYRRMIAVITGGRNNRVQDRNTLLEYLKSIKCTMVFHGGCTGIDQDVQSIVGQTYQTRVFKPDWSRYGRAAGPIRNKQMLQCAIDSAGPNVVLIAYSGGAGTLNTIDCAVSMHINIVYMR